uniref:Galactose-3-O-sulfotransferase 4 n=1 Tax=Erpetoichthys calabaricus TaxID=27687 RepID=A0A8C4TLJ7_ERPCA
WTRTEQYLDKSLRRGIVFKSLPASVMKLLFSLVVLVPKPDGRCSQWKGSEVRPLQTNKSDEKQSPRSCQPKTNVMFLKTHKTASSTILNLLCRFGDKHNLTFALPTNYRFGYPEFFSSRSIKAPACGERLGVLRFFLPAEKHNERSTRDHECWRQMISEYYQPKLQNSYLARNLLWFDFGFDHNQSFSLILLADYFDQSMVLLRDALCWSLDDMITFRLNSRSTVARKHLSRAQEDQVKQWNAMDWYLYQHFNKTFWQRVESFGKSRMDQEVASLQARRKELENLCILQVRNGEQNKYGQARILGYDLNLNLSLPDKERCLRMILTELQYTDLLDKKQFPRTGSVPKQLVAKRSWQAPIQGLGVNKRSHVIWPLGRFKKKLLRGQGQHTPH